MNRKILTLILLLLIASPLLAVPPVVTLSNVKLVDRICSVEDAYGFQPSNEKYCTMTYRETVPGSDGTYRRWTVYCPNAAVDGQALTTSYQTCSDPSAQQINHPTQNYQVIGWLRTPAQAADGKGQVLAYQVGY